MNRFSKGLIAAATSVALLSGTTAVAHADTATNSTQGTALSVGTTAVLGSSVGYTVLYYAAVVAIAVGAYNWAVDQHLIQPVALPR